MTAYGRTSISSPLGRFVAEIQSVNRKYLEVNVHLPSELSFFETDVRKWIASKVNRGKVTVKISAKFENEIPLSVSPNLLLARQLWSAWSEIAKDLKLEGGESLSLEMLTKEAGIITYQEELEDEGKYRAVLSQVVSEALEAFDEMKGKEGGTIQEDFLKRLSDLKTMISKIEKLTEGNVKRYREKIKKQIEEVLPGAVDNEDRILREICLFADKVDISEEITRFHSHIDQFSQLLQGGTEGIGKTLEFILQELQRETNTIGSKTSEIETSKLVVEMKSEIEKIREQVQNVE